MAVLAIEWQHLEQPDTGPSYGPFSKGIYLNGLHDFCDYFCEIHIHGVF